MHQMVKGDAAQFPEGAGECDREVLALLGLKGGVERLERLRVADVAQGNPGLKTDRGAGILEQGDEERDRVSVPERAEPLCRGGTEFGV